MPPDERQRLFFALWPDTGLRQRLKQRLTEGGFYGAGGQPVPPDNFHITLRYLGWLSSAERRCAGQVAGNIRASAFQLVLNRTGYWSGSRVAWLGADNWPAALLDLNEQVQKGLEQCGLEPESRPYQPHLTYLRKAAVPPGPSAGYVPVTWWVDSFVLVHSVTVPGGVRYEVVDRWILTAE